MKTVFTTTILGFGKHASIEIPLDNLREIGGNKRAPLRVTVNGHTYQSTATGVDGKCMVVFPMKERTLAGVDSGDTVEVRLELDAGYREVVIPKELASALEARSLQKRFSELTYSKRKEFAVSVAEAKAEATRQWRIEKVLQYLSGSES